MDKIKQAGDIKKIDRNKATKIFPIMDLQLFADPAPGDPSPQPNPQPAPAPAPAPAPQPNPNPQQTFTAEYVQALRGEAASYRTQLRSLENSVRTSLGLAADAPVTEAQVSQFVTDKNSAVETATASAKQMLIKAEIVTQAAALKIVDAEAAEKLAKLDGVVVGDDGKVTGVKEALEALIKDRQWLVGKTGGIGSPGNPGGDPAPAADQFGKEAAERQVAQHKTQVDGQKHYFGV